MKINIYLCIPYHKKISLYCKTISLYNETSYIKCFIKINIIPNKHIFLKKDNCAFLTLKICSFRHFKDFPILFKSTSEKIQLFYIGIVEFSYKNDVIFWFLDFF
ncbi:hypothetical protein H311_02094 [Anncaliia algerae PRA109]|nr:hypothetical protein H311_02094 [Anncaliia algerae PRA109]